jgi:hypothetical protein
MSKRKRNRKTNIFGGQLYPPPTLYTPPIYDSENRPIMDINDLELNRVDKNRSKITQYRQVCENSIKELERICANVTNRKMKNKCQTNAIRLKDILHGFNKLNPSLEDMKFIEELYIIDGQCRSLAQTQIGLYSGKSKLQQQQRTIGTNIEEYRCTTDSDCSKNFKCYDSGRLYPVCIPSGERPPPPPLPTKSRISRFASNRPLTEPFSQKNVEMCKKKMSGRAMNLKRDLLYPGTTYPKCEWIVNEYNNLIRNAINNYTGITQCDMDWNNLKSNMKNLSRNRDSKNRCNEERRNRTGNLRISAPTSVKQYERPGRNIISTIPIKSKPKSRFFKFF